jgi:hypothetical protein
LHAALIDRVLHHCHLVNIRGNSCRMRHHRTPDPDEPNPPIKKRSAKGG